VGTPCRRAAAVLLAVAAVLGVSPTASALAGLGAVTAKSQSVGVPKWSAVISAAAATPATTGAPTAALDNDTYWWISNNGTATLDPHFTVTLTVVTTGGASAQLEQCSGPPNLVQDNWDQSTGTCLGTGTLSVIAYANTPTPYVLPASYPVGAAVRLRLHVTANGAGNTAALNVTVSR
jgi:hypothetical protein